jgi:endonuclease/exonuclease/phosphatase family metal-dependent hydrolase
LLAALALAWPAAAAAWPLDIKVLSYNVRGAVDQQRRQDLGAVSEVVRRQSPDIMVVQELPRGLVEPLARDTGFLHFQGVAAYGPEPWRVRLGVFSRWPFTTELVFLPGTKRRVAKAAVDIQGIPLVVYGVHLSREGLTSGKGLLKEMLGAGARARQMEGVVADIGADPRRFKVLAGDLNTFPLSGPYRLLAGVLDDAFSSVFAPGTYRMDTLKGSAAAEAPNPKIDHIFHSQSLASLSARVVQEGPSDHYPVTAVLRLPVRDLVRAPEEVRRLQQRLARAGLYAGEATGELDPATRRALAAFQRRSGLAVDGLAGEAARELLRRQAP